MNRRHRLELADFKWPAIISVTLSNLCLENKVTDRTWLNILQFQHKSNPNDELNLFKVLKCTIGVGYNLRILQRRPSHGMGKEADIFITSLREEGNKCLALEASAKFLCI